MVPAQDLVPADALLAFIGLSHSDGPKKEVTL